MVLVVISSLPCEPNSRRHLVPIEIRRKYLMSNKYTSIWKFQEASNILDDTSQSSLVKRWKENQKIHFASHPITNIINGNIFLSVIDVLINNSHDRFSEFSNNKYLILYWMKEKNRIIFYSIILNLRLLICLLYSCFITLLFSTLSACFDHLHIISAQ